MHFQEESTVRLNDTPYERVPQGHPTIVDYFYHEEVRGTANSGERNKKTD